MHAALGDPTRLAIVDHLMLSDRTPSELGVLLDVPSNLMAHHLETLERVGLVGRTRSNGDARRRYVHVLPGAFTWHLTPAVLAPQPALFICTHNSARSQLAAALWTATTGHLAQSAGTHPAENVHRLALAAARKVGLSLGNSRPQSLDSVAQLPALVVTVCDQVHEELDAQPTWLHWSVPDPSKVGTRTAFDSTIDSLRWRITSLLGSVAA